MRLGRRGPGFWLGLIVLVAASGCSGAGPGKPAPAAGGRDRAAGAPAGPLAEAVTAAPRVTVRVMAVERAGAAAIIARLMLGNPDPAAPVAIGDRFGAAPGDAGSLAGVHLLDQSGRRKLYVLRDAQDRVQCTTGLGEIPPAGSVEAWVRLPVPGDGASRVTVQVPGLPPFRDLPVSDPSPGTGQVPPSY